MIETPYTRLASRAVAELFDGIAKLMPIKRQHPARAKFNKNAHGYYARKKFLGMRKEDAYLAARRVSSSAEK